MFGDTFERFGQLFQLAIVIAQQIPRDILGSREKTQELIDNPGDWGPRLRQTFAEEVAAEAAPQPKSELEQPAAAFKKLEVIEITLDPSLSLAEQIRLGNYPAGCVHSAYSDGRVKLSGKSGKRQLVILDPKGEATISEMVERAKALRLSLPVWDDAVATGYQKPRRQLKNPLVFSTEETVLDVGGGPCVPILDDWRRKRILFLRRAGDRFSEHVRFVFVREL